MFNDAYQSLLCNQPIELLIWSIFPERTNPGVGI